MTQWTVQQWAAFASILVMAVSAIAMCVRNQTVNKAMAEEFARHRLDCEAHRNNSNIHRNEDYKNWIDFKFSGLNQKLDEILIEQKRGNKQ